MTPVDPNDFRAKQYDVLVSYSRADDDERAELVKALEDRGYQVFWDGKLGPDYWRVEWRNRLNQSRLMIVLWSVTAAQSVEVQVEAGGALQLERCLSVPLDGNDHVPKPYLETNRHHWDREADPARRQEQLEKILTKVAEIVGPPRGRPDTVGNATIPVEFGEIQGAPPRLVGREAELAMLWEAWESKAPRKVNAVVLHALGGSGKSALLRTFANGLLAKGGGGARRIYGWSAYSQGSGEQKRADADSFISKALADFGLEGNLPKDPVERARALARLIQRERTLLLLDGLEPLQDPPGVNRGRFKDKGIAELVKILAKVNPGLVILTTRQEVPELDGHGSLVIAHALEELSDMAGADLLVELGVRGRQRDLEAAVRSVDGHALSVTLLGTYIAEVCGGDIRHSDQFDFSKIVLTQAEQEELATDKTIIAAKRAAKVMHGYLEQFEKLGKKAATAGLGGPERAILHLLGLFDRPADGEAIAKLLKERIPGLTDDLFVETTTTTAGLWFWKSSKVAARGLTPSERAQRIRYAKERLRKLRLLSKPNQHDPMELDAHPIVRAYFSGRLAETAPNAAAAAHDILYRHYSAAAPDLPDTLEQMQPLFHAVRHGVNAGRAQEAFQDIYLRRIRRLKKHYIVFSMGAHGADLNVLACFFDTPWAKPRLDLTETSKALLLDQAARDLVAVGRLKDSIAPTKKALELFAALGDWTALAAALADHSTVLLQVGNVAEASAAAAKALEVTVAKQRPELTPPRMADFAITIFFSGDTHKAKAQFVESEKLNKGPLPGWRGYIFGELLLDEGNNNDALLRADTLRDELRGRKLTRRGRIAINEGFAHLLRGRTEDCLQEGSAADSFEEAVNSIRRAGTEQFLPLALLARAVHRRRRAATGEKSLIDGIRADLVEVEDIAGEEMRLYLTDLALERARLALDVPAAFANPAAAHAEAEAQTQRAARLIAETGYHRRDGELKDLQARLAAG